LEAGDVQLHWGQRIPLRDGVDLNATVFMPARPQPPRPCIFTLTPYISDRFHERGIYFATHGYPFLIVDVRGRGNSGGTFRPRIQEARDGYDVTEWIAAQSYCNGKVAMWGGSYAGYAQWATAKEFPPHLAAIAPAAAPHYGTDVPMRNNIFSPYAIRWLLFVAGRTAQTELFSDTAYWSRVFRRWHESGRSLRELDDIAGMHSATLQEYLSHPEPDAYWDAYNPTDAEYAELDLPVLTITGIYDGDQPGALEHYKRHFRCRGDVARSRHHLIIGPWDHAGTRTPTRSFGGLTFGPESLVALGRLHLEWYSWVMEGGTPPAFLANSVVYYVTGLERWRHADSLELATAREQRLFLDSDGSANGIFHAGSMTVSSATGPPDSYIYDPRDTSGPEVEAEAMVDPTSIVDQSIALALEGRQLVYHSAPFEHDTEITGFFKLSAWISIDTPDTDFYVCVHEVDRNGAVIRLTTDAIRARYRTSLRSAALVDTSAPLRYDFDRFTFVSRLVPRGHRLRLTIAPTGRFIESAFTEKNYNAGGVVAAESSRDGRAVKVTLFHDAAHPSALYVPIGQLPESP
jgi:putative CocE/NonD family hydrolase